MVYFPDDISVGTVDLTEPPPLFVRHTAWGHLWSCIVSFSEKIQDLIDSIASVTNNLISKAKELVPVLPELALRPIVHFYIFEKILACFINNQKVVKSIVGTGAVGMGIQMVCTCFEAINHLECQKNAIEDNSQKKNQQAVEYFLVRSYPHLKLYFKIRIVISFLIGCGGLKILYEELL
jgi:hypothetical protein